MKDKKNKSAIKFAVLFAAFMAIFCLIGCVGVVPDDRGEVDNTNYETNLFDNVTTLSFTISPVSNQLHIISGDDIPTVMAYFNELQFTSKDSASKGLYDAEDLMFTISYKGDEKAFVTISADGTVVYRGSDEDYYVSAEKLDYDAFVDVLQGMVDVWL